MDIELEELKRHLRSKRFSLDEIVPLTQKAARTIERLQAENAALANDLRVYQTDAHENSKAAVGDSNFSKL